MGTESFYGSLPPGKPALLRAEKGCLSPFFRNLLALILLSLGTAAVLLSFDGPPKGTSPGKAAAPPKTPAGSGGAQEDRDVEAKIRAKLTASKIGKDGFTVRVQGGIAYWEGSTSVVQHKGSATRMAKTAGAKKVVNNIKISEAARQKAGDNLDQGRRRVQVKRGDTRSEATQ